MRMKYKIVLLLLLFIIFVFGFGLTYSFFNSNASLSSVDQSIAKFVFNAEDLDQLHLSLIDMKPGDVKEYPFSVSNSSVDVISDVSLEYQLTLKTYHLVPFVIKLFKVNGEEETNILNCTEGVGRNQQNEFICNAPLQTMGYNKEILDDYRLEVEFPSMYDDIRYSGLVDYIDVTIKSWQKTNN